MKKLFSFLFLFSFMACAQAQIGDASFGNVNVQKALTIGASKSIKGVSSDTSTTGGSNDSLITSLAVKKMVSKILIGGGGAWGSIGGMLSDQLDLVSYISSQLSPYIKNPGYGLNKSGQTLILDSATLANTFLRRKDSFPLPGGFLTYNAADQRYLPKTGAVQTKYEPQFFAYNGHTSNAGINFINNFHGVYFGGEHPWNYGGFRIYMPLSNTYDIIVGAKISIYDLRHGKSGQIDMTVYDLSSTVFSVTKTFAPAIRFRTGIDASNGNRFFLEIGDSTTNWGDAEINVDYELVSRTDPARPNWFTTTQGIQLDSLFTGTKIIDTLLAAAGTGGGGGGVSGVSDFNGRTGSITPQASDYTGIYPLLSGSYNNPSWVNQLAWSKITSAPGFLLPADTANKYVTGGIRVGDTLRFYKGTSYIAIYAPVVGGSIDTLSLAPPLYNRGDTLALDYSQFQPADSTKPGVVSTTAQKLGGAKRFMTSVQAPLYLNKLQTLTEGSTITMSIDSGTVAKVTLTATGRTLTLANLPTGYVTYISLTILQDATGGRTITTWPTGVKWKEGIAPTLTATANARDIVTFYYDGTTLFGNYGNDYK